MPPDSDGMNCTDFLFLSMVFDDDDSAELFGREGGNQKWCFQHALHLTRGLRSRSHL